MQLQVIAVPRKCDYDLEEGFHGCNDDHLICRQGAFEVAFDIWELEARPHLHLIRQHTVNTGAKHTGSSQDKHQTVLHLINLLIAPLMCTNQEN